MQLNVVVVLPVYCMFLAEAVVAFAFWIRLVRWGMVCNAFTFLVEVFVSHSPLPWGHSGLLLVLQPSDELLVPGLVNRARDPTLPSALLRRDAHFILVTGYEIFANFL
jgi:hypothetical protein